MLELWKAIDVPKGCADPIDFTAPIKLAKHYTLELLINEEMDQLPPELDWRNDFEIPSLEETMQEVFCAPYGELNGF